MLEIQERISETEEREALLDILSETEERKKHLEVSLGEAFFADQLQKASEIVTELSYLDRILDQTKQRL